MKSSKRWLLKTGVDSLFIITGIACFILLRAISAHASWLAVPLIDRINDADLVILGELQSVNPKYFSITWHQSKPPYTSIYDIGDIKIEKVLKGSWHEGKLTIQFDHPNQPKHPFRHMLRSFQPKQRGIWILHRTDGGFFEIRRPDNFMDVDKLQEVTDTIKSAGKQEGKKSRIIVKKDPNDPSRVVAYYESNPEFPRASGINKYEAIGQLILLYKDKHSLEFEVIE